MEQVFNQWLKAVVVLLFTNQLIDLWLDKPNPYGENPYHQKFTYEIREGHRTLQLCCFVGTGSKIDTIEDAEHGKKMQGYNHEEDCKRGLHVTFQVNDKEIEHKKEKQHIEDREQKKNSEGSEIKL